MIAVNRFGTALLEYPKKSKAMLVSTLLTAMVCTVVSLYASRILQRPAFGFLSGQRPIVMGLMPLYAQSTEMEEYFIYSVPREAFQYGLEMAEELSGIGFQCAASKIGERPIRECKAANTYVSVEAGRSFDRSYMAQGPSQEDGWCTVLVVRTAPDDWISHLRYGLEPNE